jgi:hypothetical protein
MAVRAGGAYAGAIVVMNGLLVFFENKFFHLVTGNTEFFRVGCIHGVVEADPENTGHSEYNQYQEAQ